VLQVVIILEIIRLMKRFDYKLPRLLLVSLLFILNPQLIFAQASAPNFPAAGILSKDTNNFIDEDRDYSLFSGRVSDKQDQLNIFKIQVENNNTKFFRAGDVAYFKVNLYKSSRECKSYVKSVEEFYFVIQVQDISLCYDEDKYFRRGTVLNFRSPILAQRVFEASKYREMLLVRKDDFMKQLNQINNFIYAFDQEKVKAVAEIDQEINRLEKKRRKAIDNLVVKKQESMVLQNELIRQLNALDESLRYYKVERQEAMTDRWNLDHDLSIPVGRRPMPIRKP
jgi:hypothetical protein